MTERKKEATVLVVFVAVTIVAALTTWAFFSPAVRLLFISDNVKFAAEVGTWEGRDEAYLEAIEIRNSIAQEGDIAKWVVSSGSTVTGKLIRFVVLAGIIAGDVYILHEWYDVVQLLPILAKRARKKIRRKLRRCYKEMRARFNLWAVEAKRGAYKALQKFCYRIYKAVR